MKRSIGTTRRFFHPSPRRRARPFTPPVAAVESLEDRVMLSNAAIVGGNLIVNGSAQADVIVADHVGGVEGQIRVRVFENGQRTVLKTFTEAQVNVISLVGRGGGDILVNRTEIADVLLGGDGDDIFSAGSDRSVALGGKGNDFILGLEGNDVLLGGGGNDLVLGGAGHDRLDGQAGDDRLFGDAGFDVIGGQAGVDQLHGGTQNDRVNGGLDTDVLYGDGDNDILDGGSGNNVLNGGNGIDTVTESGDTNIIGVMLGNSGFLLTAAVITPTPEIDSIDSLVDIENAVLTGGAGDNSITASGFSGTATINGGAGDDILSASTLFFGPSATGNAVIRGGAGDDSIVGGLGDDILEGGAGIDTIVGNDGDDSIDGGLFAQDQTPDDGFDVITAGDGDDRIDSDNHADSVDGGLGNDTGVSPGHDTLADNPFLSIENVVTDLNTFPWS